MTSKPLMTLSAAITLLALAGCGGSDGSDGLATLFNVTAEAPGENCAAGGSRIEVGLDRNRNGILDPDEVDTTTYACHGQHGSDGSDALATLIVLTEEPAGANCPHGGAKVESGLDANGNGVLEADEVGATAYVCHGEDGSDGSDGAAGADGHTTLVAVTPEPAGEHCPTGGSRVDSGVDANGNGVLDAEEIAATSYVCSGPGVVWLEADSDMQALPNTGYLATADTQITITLPGAPAVGDIVRVSGVGAGGWRLAQNEGQSIATGNIPSGIGVAWTAREEARDWVAVASSADGTRLVAVVWDGPLYTSADGGVTWTARQPNRNWSAVATSADGNTVIASTSIGPLYISDDGGITWTVRGLERAWRGVASSADGTRMVAVADGSYIYYSSDGGENWDTALAQVEIWRAVSSSADGMRLVAVSSANAKRLYTSDDAGASWAAHGPAVTWSSVASSADGMRLVATGGGLHTSSDAGVSWTTRETPSLSRVASSADGSRLVGAAWNGRVHTSRDAGLTWMARGQDRAWYGIASSADGTRLVAVVRGDHIYTSTPGTTPGTGGAILGGAFEAVELQYTGNGVFTVLSYNGDLQVE